MGSLTLYADPSVPLANIKLPAYNVSRSAAKGTLQLAYNLKDTTTKINTVHPV